MPPPKLLAELPLRGAVGDSQRSRCRRYRRRCTMPPPPVLAELPLRGAVGESQRRAAYLTDRR